MWRDVGILSIDGRIKLRARLVRWIAKALGLSVSVIKLDTYYQSEMF